MKEEQLGVMENEILTEENRFPAEKPEENLQNSPKKPPVSQSLRNWFYKLRAPKPVTYIILMCLIVIIYTSLLLTAQKNTKQSPKPSPSPSTEPTPEPIEDTALNEIIRKVDAYNKNLDLLNSTTRKFEPPNIDLDINFSDKK